MRIGLIILCYMLALHLKGQNTICKLSGECLVAEVQVQNRPFQNKSELRFKLPGEKKAGSLDRKDLSYIRFSSDRLDVFKPDLKVNVDTADIYLTKKSLLYKGERIFNADVLKLITAYPYVEKRELLLHEHTKLRRNARHRVVNGSLGISQICNYRCHKKKKHIIASYNRL